MRLPGSLFLREPHGLSPPRATYEPNKKPRHLTWPETRSTKARSSGEPALAILGLAQRHAERGVCSDRMLWSQHRPGHHLRVRRTYKRACVEASGEASSLQKLPSCRLSPGCVVLPPLSRSIPFRRIRTWSLSTGWFSYTRENTPELKRSPQPAEASSL